MEKASFAFGEFAHQGRTEQAKRASNARNAKANDGLDKIRGVNPITTEIDYSREEVEFALAVQSYKQRTGRQFPTCHEILGIARDLGYQKIGMSA